MTFFSQDRQSRLIARALWNGERRRSNCLTSKVSVSRLLGLSSVDSNAAEERYNERPVDAETRAAAAMKKITAFLDGPSVPLVARSS